jgi:hypothetical protein
MERYVEHLRNLGLLGPDEEPEIPVVVERLATLAPHPANVEAVQQLAQEAPKELAKAARRLLHQWRSQGLAITAARGKAPAWRLEAPPKELGAWLSHIDGQGERLVIYSFSRPASPYLVMAAVIGDTAGISWTEVYETGNKKNWQALLDKLRGTEGLTWVAADPAYCRAWLKHCYQVSRRAGQPVPREFEIYRSSLGPEEPLPPPLIYRHLSTEEVNRDRSSLLADSDRLLEEKELGTWFFEGPKVEEAAETIRHREQSPLVISSAAEEEVVERVKRKLLEELFVPEFRPVFARRLEEMAYVFWATDRQRHARQAVALAQVLGEETSLFLIPFFQRLIARTIAQALSEEPAPPEARSPLYLPGRVGTPGGRWPRVLPPPPR